MAVRTTIWPLESHTAAKHAILQKYLHAWLPKLTRWNGRVIICDGFAGPGVYSQGERGSPLIALDAYLEHSHRERMQAEILYLFIEQDAKRFESLKEVLDDVELPKNVHVHPVHNEYEATFGYILNYIEEQGSRLAPTFAFIDPFGIQGFPMELVRRLMANKSCEVFITFMVSYLHRFIASPEFESHCDRLFGVADWRVARDLSGDERETFLRTLYQRQLENEAGAGHVRFFTMRDTKNRPIYDLFFATKDENGIDAMKDAMWNIDNSGSFTFSDATDPSQVTLFTSEPDWAQLIAILCSRFAGQTVKWPKVKEAIRRTPFRIRKRPLQQEAKRSHAQLKIISPAGSRQGTLSDESKISFLSPDG